MPINGFVIVSSSHLESSRSASPKVALNVLNFEQCNYEIMLCATLLLKPSCLNWYKQKNECI